MRPIRQTNRPNTAEEAKQLQAQGIKYGYRLRRKAWLASQKSHAQGTVISIEPRNQRTARAEEQV